MRRRTMGKVVVAKCITSLVILTVALAGIAAAAAVPFAPARIVARITTGDGPARKPEVSVPSGSAIFAKRPSLGSTRRRTG